MGTATLHDGFRECITVLPHRSICLAHEYGSLGPGPWVAAPRRLETAPRRDETSQVDRLKKRTKEVEETLL